MEPCFFATFSKDEAVRLGSSSGGVFSELASLILDRQGVVFGAKFDENYHVVHGFAQTPEEVQAFMGSKYVQSRTGGAYAQAESFLRQGRQVLYSGTPCQIAGLRAFLGRDEKNLLTVDILCHGVPSQAMWSSYLAQRSQGKGVISVTFRDKTRGWRPKLIHIRLADGSSYQCYAPEDLYHIAFLKNMILRPSCYACHFKLSHSQADLTIGDFWGVADTFPDMNDNKGISLVLPRTAAGWRIWKALSPRLEVRTVDAEHALIRNSTARRSVKIPDRRERFFKEAFRDGALDLDVLEKLEAEPSPPPGTPSALPAWGPPPPAEPGLPVLYPSKEECCGCEACRAACPKGAIAMEPDGETFLYPRIDAALCVNCRKCQRVCPIGGKREKAQ